MALQQLQPELGSPKRNETEVATRVESLLRKIRAQEELLRPSGGRHERRVWTGILGYVNADLSTDAKAYAGLLTVLNGLTRAPELTEFRLTEFGKDDDFFCLSELGGIRKRDFASLAVHYQKKLKDLLSWICQPKSRSELRLEALEFLEVNAHGEEWHIDYDEDPVSSLGDFDERKGPFLYFVKQVKFASIMSPICKFLFEFVDDPPKPLPIRICKRSGCDKLILPERKGRKEYCSPRCCALDHRPVAKENKDYMWLYRLNKIKSDGTLRRRLREDSGAVRRLRQIETHWKDQPKFTEKIEEIRKRARL
jgi:hypothetical protein